MGILSKVFSASAAEPIEAVGKVLDELFTSDDEKLSKQEALLRLGQQPQLATLEIAKVQAQHRSIWVAGARPFILWVCGVALFTYFIPQHLMAAIVWVQQIGQMSVAQLSVGLPPYPIEPKAIMELVLALLGLGSLRTVEKLAGKAK